MKAVHLEHLSLRAEYAERLPGHLASEYGDVPIEFRTPLLKVVPAYFLLNLVHFGLSNYVVKADDVASLLTFLPPTLRSVELLR